MNRLVALLAFTMSLLSSSASAQAVVTHDTLGGGGAVAITCGFCATERYGVVFRDLPSPSRGVLPEDFPITMRTVLIAVANARVTGSAGAYSCAGEAVAGEANVDLEVWSGSETVTGSIRDLPVDGAWNESENLVWAGVDVPLVRSAAESAGSSNYPEATFNEVMLVDEMSAAPVVDAGATYLRIVVTLKPDATDRSASCADAGNESPAAFPMRDADGVISDERSFGYALGVGWFWNEEPAFSIGGDWAIRLSISPSATPTPDAGVLDGGAGDSGAMDAAGSLDAGTGTDAGNADATVPPVADDGGCSAAGSGAPIGIALTWIALFALGSRVVRRRVRRSGP